MIKVPDNNILGAIVIETATLSADKLFPAKIIKTDGDRTIAEGILQEANMKNRNGRYYDSRDLFPELTAPRQIELLSTGNMKAENGHPLAKDLARQQTIDPNNCVAIFTKFWTEGNFVMGQYFGTYNDKGEEFDKELKHGYSPSWSLRALGTIRNTSRGAEVKGIKLITYDRVIYPSHNKAYTTRIVSESTNLNYSTGTTNDGQNKLFLESSDSGMVEFIYNRDVLDYIKEESMSYKRIKESFDVLYDDIQLINGGTQIQLKDNVGSSYIINLEEYIHHEIMNNCISSVEI